MAKVDKNETVLRARRLRRSMSLPEGLLWQMLRTRPGGLKFRRQHPLDWYIADFYCPAARLVIEIDGQVHNRHEQVRHDIKRDSWLRRQGFRVIRFAADDVMKDGESIVRNILEEARRLPLHHPRNESGAGSPPQDGVLGRN